MRVERPNSCSATRRIHARTVECYLVDAHTTCRCAKRGLKTSGQRRKTKSSERRAAIVETSGVGEGLTPSLTDGPTCSAHEDPIMEKLRRELVDSISSQLPLIPVSQIVNDCLTVFFQRSFPTLSICHEPTLCIVAQCFFGSGENNERTDYDSRIEHALIHLMRSFALLTAVCAATAFMHQGTFLVYDAIGPLFFGAWRI